MDIPGDLILVKLRDFEKDSSKFGVLYMKPPGILKIFSKNDSKFFL